MWTKFIEAEIIKPIDLQLANHLAGDASPDVKAFFIHLSITMRRGHVCIERSAEIRPIWELVETDKELNPITPQEWQNIESLVRQGMDNIPSTLAQNPSDQEPLNLNPIVLNGSKIYTQRTWLAETRFLKRLNAFQNCGPGCQLTSSDIQKKITEHQLENLLLAEQKQAILNSHAPLSLIAGGPGTGKTYTAGWMVRILAELLEEKLGHRPTIALAAPTGKAALHLEKSLQRVGGNLAHCKGETLHTLLSKLPLHADLIVVDEASMIDLEWMNKLLKEISANSRLILIGDPHQLPPVGMGSIFVDMIHRMPHTSLEKCLRTDIQSIVQYASAIKQGEYQPWDKEYPLDDPQTLIAQCVHHYKKCRTAEDFFHFKVLTPFSKGPFGTEQLNQKILQALGKQETIPILITKNDYELEVFNGEQALWIPSRGVVQLPKRSGEGIREIPFSLIGAYELGYCLSIHKSQGSEYSHVIVVFPEGAQIFGREALYTAVTRAKRELEIYSPPHVLQQTIQRSNRRYSGLN